MLRVQNQRTEAVETTEMQRSNLDAIARNWSFLNCVDSTQQANGRQTILLVSVDTSRNSLTLIECGVSSKYQLADRRVMDGKAGPMNN